MTIQFSFQDEVIHYLFYSFWTLLSICLLSYISSLYNDNEFFFRYDFKLLSKKNNGKIKRLLFILKNDYCLIITICFLQAILNVFLNYFVQKFLPEDLFKNGKLANFLYLTAIAILMAVFQELFPRWIASKSKNFSLNAVCLFFAYLLTKLGRLFSFFSEENKRITVESEKDIIRFIKNLTFDNVVEKEEAQLAQAAFDFDELTVSDIMVPRSEVVFLEEAIKNREVIKIHLKHSFSYYPVIKNDQICCGVFNFKKFSNWQDDDHKKKWQQTIVKEVVCFSPKQHLDKVLEKAKNDELTIAIVKNEKEEFVGIVTRKDIFNALIGKKRNTKDDELKKEN